MPKVFSFDGYTFFFFSNEGLPREKCHIHVRKGECLAKFWIDPDVYLASNYGFSSKELNRLSEIIVSHEEAIRSYWNEYFG
jgi:hypothetical protein